ncbi:imidazolonepropionase [bacterium MnTg04]|nr:imidazolonepropionase [bacterium MnTg04]
MGNMIKALFATCIILSAAISGADAQDRTALVGGRLIDGYGHAPIQNSVILIEDDTIIKVGTVDTLPIPDGYKVVSTDGMDVLPGLWESHAHLMLSGHADYPHWQATYLDRLADEIMPATASHLLLAGVTSARDLGGHWSRQNQSRSGSIAVKFRGRAFSCPDRFCRRKSKTGKQPIAGLCARWLMRGQKLRSWMMLAWSS